MKKSFKTLSRIGTVLVFGSLLLRSGDVRAQNALKVLEKDQDGSYLDAKGNPKPGYINSPIVDINSTLLISIDKAQIIRQLGQAGTYNLPPDVSKLLGILDQAMQQQSVMLSDFKATIASYDPASPASVKTFNAKLQQFASTVNLLFKTDPVLLAAYRKLMNDPKAKIADNVFIALKGRISDLENSVSQSSSSDPNTIQLGAWINKGAGPVPLHLKGFDQIADQPYFTVDRWQYLPTADQLAQFQQLQQYAQQNRDNSLDILRSSANQYLNAIKGYGQTLVADNLADINQAFSAIKADYNGTPLGGQLDKLKTDFEALTTLIKDKEQLYDSMLSSGNTISGSAVITEVTTDLVALNAAVSQIKQDITVIVASVNSLVPVLKMEAQNMVKILAAKNDSLFKVFDMQLLTGLTNGSQADDSALQFSSQVIKLSLTDLPLSTELDLNNTGERKPGDRIELVMNVVNKGKNLQVGSYSTAIYGVLLHLQGTVGLLFAHPTTHTSMNGPVQMAPYFNLLVKSAWPWTEKYHRKAAINNKFLDFSYGLQVSSPDFNKDDVPELGVGFVISGFKDIIQVGIAHDVFLNVPFVFFGIRLPIPATNFGSGGQTNSNP